jgi:hypothetical protein
MPDSPSSVTSHGRINYGYLEQVPEKASTATRQRVTDRPQNDATRLTNIVLPKIPISIRRIIKGSTQESSFPNEIHYSSSNGLTHSVNSFEDDTGCCNTQVFNKEGFQHIGDFKLHNEMQWNKQDYSDYNDKETYIPGFNDINVVLPSNKRIESSNSHTYYAHPSQDLDTISDVYAQNQVSSNRVVLPFNRPNIMDLVQQLLSVNHDMQWGPLTMSHDNAVDELEPIQEVKKNSFPYWGANGMPFNVLYMKPASKPTVVRVKQMVTPVPPTTSQRQQVAVQNAPRNGNSRGGRKSRRQLFPPFFTWYSWVSRGK